MSASMFVLEELLMYFPGLILQPHGFFNCSPAVDVPPNTHESDVKENNGVVAKPVQNGLIAKL